MDRRAFLAGGGVAVGALLALGGRTGGVFAANRNGARVDARMSVSGEGSEAVREVKSATTTFGSDKYGRAIVIDAQGVIGDPDPTATLESAPSQRLLSDLHASGLTAVSVTLSVGSTGDRMMLALRKIAIFDEKVAAAPLALMRIRRAADLYTAKSTRRLGLIYNLQDSSLLENDLARVVVLQELGVRVMQLTYNTRNLVGDGCLEQANAGLSNLGRELVAQLGRQRIVMDLSHSGQRTIAEGIALATRPPVISHTGCRNLTEKPRNVYDTELRALADKGGVAGIYFMPFLSASGPAHSADLIRHLEHAVNVCGEDHVGIGTDGGIAAVELNDAYRQEQRQEYEKRVAQGIAAPGETADSYDFILEYNEPARYRHLADDLAARGWSAGRIEKVLGLNFSRVFTEVWG
ncbi:MAG TPA: membrane dipeptidase [Steroidobacteraceae bacterium]